MNMLRRRWGWPVACGLIGLLIVAFLPVSTPVDDDVETPIPTAETARPIGPIFAGARADQDFPATGTSIRSVALFLATYQRVNRGTARVEVQVNADGQWRNLAATTVRKESLQDNAYYTASFSPPVRVEKGQRVRISLTADGGGNDAIAWWTNTTWNPDGYSLTFNNQPRQGTARLRVSYAAASGPLLRMLRPLWARVTVFLGPLWRVVLIIGLGALIGSFVALGAMPER